MATVDVPPPLLSMLKDFRMGKRSEGASALVFKIDKKKLQLELEESFEAITLDDLQEGACHRPTVHHTSYTPLFPCRVARELSKVHCAFLRTIASRWTQEFRE